MWAPRALAQSPAKGFRLGLLNAGAPIANNSAMGSPLIRGLARHGYAPDGNLAIERRGAEGKVGRLPQLVAEVVASKVDVIVTLGYRDACGQGGNVASSRNDLRRRPGRYSPCRQPRPTWREPHRNFG